MIIEMIGIFILSLGFLFVKYKITLQVYLISLFLFREIAETIEKNHKIVGSIGQKYKVRIVLLLDIVILTIRIMIVYEFVEFFQTIPTIYKDIVKYTLSIINNGI